MEIGIPNRTENHKFCFNHSNFKCPCIWKNARICPITNNIIPKKKVHQINDKLFKLKYQINLFKG